MEKNLLDAVNSALEPAQEKPDDQEAAAAESGGGDLPAAEAADAEGAAEDADQEAGKSDAESDEPSVGGDPEDPAAVKPDPVAKLEDGKKKDEAADAKKIDPVNDPIPANMHPRTKERIKALVDTVKGQEKDLTVQRELFQSIQETGVTAENFAKTLGFLRVYNSPKTEDRELAYQFLTNELRALAISLGKNPPGGDALEGHQDLLDAVAAQSVTREYAEELARNRNKAQLQNQETETRATADKEYNAAHAQATADLNMLGKTLKAADPLWEQKSAILVPQIREIAKTLHPSRWVGEFQRLYSEAQVTTPVGAPTAKPNGGPQPLRANKQPSGEGKKQPSSLLEAISGAITQ